MRGFWGEGDSWPPEQDNTLTWLAHVRECASFLAAVPVLGELDETALWRLAQRATDVTFEPGESVLAQGDTEPDRRFYVIRGGSADVVRRDRAGMDQVVARLACGGYFGELGLLTNQARNATIRVHGGTPLRTYAFDAVAFHAQIAEQVLVFKLIRERRKQRRAGISSRVRLDRLGLLDGMRASDLEVVFRNAEQRTYAEGACIVEQGEVGDRFYVLLSGAVAIERDDEAIATLAPGEFFGETALLFDTPRTATVRATEPSSVWSITRSAFQRVVGHHLMSNPATQLRIMQRAGRLLQGNQPG